MRTGPGIENKITAMVPSGQAVEIVTPGDQWSFVRLPNGKEGWVLTRFLTANLPLSITLENLKKEHETLKERAASLETENTELKSENQTLSTELTTAQQRLSEITGAYEALKSESTEFLELKTNYQESAAKLTDQTQKVARYEEELTRLTTQHNIRWFLSGAGVLLFGFIIGFMTKRQRRRPSLL
jgi:SH3 domain protein